MSDVIFELHAHHTRRSPVFVIGYPRSGTSVTCRLLRRYLKVSFGTESQFIIRYLRSLPEYGDLRQDANVRALLADISRERFFARSAHNWKFVFDPEKAIAALKDRTYSGVLDAIFGQLAEHNQMDRWGDKTPQYNNDLSQLRGLFPDAQFIHIVRDGRDVAISIAKTGFGPTNACATANAWNGALDRIQSFARTLSSNQYFELRYEDLMESPAETLAEVAGYLGIDDRDGALAAYTREHVRHEINVGSVGRWRRELSRRDIERFEGIAGARLAAYHYELAFAGRARPVSRQELMYWRLRGKAARVLLPRSWSDNWYKLGLRARAMFVPTRDSLRV